MEHPTAAAAIISRTPPPPSPSSPSPARSESGDATTSAARRRQRLPAPEKVAAVLRAWWQLRGCDAVGALTQVRGRVYVRNGGAIRLGARVHLRGTHLPIELAALPGGVLSIGEGSFINSGSSICARERVEIGAGCAIGNDALILDSDFHDVEDLGRPGRCAPVVLEDGVWLGARVTVLKGVRIGRGAVVGAGSVVTKDVPAHTLVAGVPARVVRALASAPERTGEEGGPPC